jgi:hypothetical protein
MTNVDSKLVGMTNVDSKLVVQILQRERSP